MRYMVRCSPGWNFFSPSKVAVACVVNQVREKEGESFCFDVSVSPPRITFFSV